MKTRTRFGRLSQVFKGGSSPVLNHIGRLSVLYEDLRLERSALINEIGKPDTPEHRYRVVYYTRRSLTTLMEYKSGLCRLTGIPEFKNAHLSKLDADSIESANRFFQSHAARIKELRNEVGGHVQQGSIDFALRSFGANEVSSVSWNSSAMDSDGLCLQLTFAGDLIAGAIASKIDPSKDVRDELQAALAMIIGGFLEVQRATYGLVHGFLWDRFGA